MKKRIIFIVLFIILSLLCILSTKSFAYDMKGGWYKKNGKYYFYHNNGQKRINDFFEDEGYWYYVDKDGVMLCNDWYQDLSTPEKYWYWANEDGSLSEGWDYIGGKWYYFNTSGKPYMLTGPQEIDNKTYLFDENGALVEKTGWAEYNSKWYWLTGGGANNTVFKGDWQYIGNVWYYFDWRTGEMYDKPTKIDGELEFFTGSGMWIKYPKNNSWFECKRNGYSDWYYVKDDKTFTNDWKLIGNEWYYFDYDGLMINQPTKIDGKIECFKESGAWVKSPANGWFRSENKKEKTTDWWYIIDHNVAKGWIKDKGDTYFLDEDTGKMYCNTKIRNYSEGKDYYLGSSGAVMKNYYVEDKEASASYRWSFYGKTGAKESLNGWKKINGDWYYFSSSNGCIVSRFVEIDGKYYLFDKEGKMLSGGWYSCNDLDEYNVWVSGCKLYYDSKLDGDDKYERVPYEFYLSDDGSAVTNGHIGNFYTDKYGRKIINY